MYKHCLRSIVVSQFQSGFGHQSSFDMDCGMLIWNGAGMHMQIAMPAGLVLLEANCLCVNRPLLKPSMCLHSTPVLQLVSTCVVLELQICRVAGDHHAMS